jgi:hypothetical protein
MNPKISISWGAAESSTIDKYQLWQLLSPSWHTKDSSTLQKEVIDSSETLELINQTT